MAFIAMRVLGIGADIMSLGGIAIAIGAMIDAAIVMTENMHKHLERAVREKSARTGHERDARAGRLSTSVLTHQERWEIAVRAAREVGPALFFSLLIITISLVPVFTLQAQEGRLFKPLAWTKTLAMACSSAAASTRRAAIRSTPCCVGFTRRFWASRSATDGWSWEAPSPRSS
jgi:Cu(I)/Ag(I) efflux system membrane protein CusA/SilA